MNYLDEDFGLYYKPGEWGDGPVIDYGRTAKNLLGTVLNTAASAFSKLAKKFEDKAETDKVGNVLYFHFMAKPINPEYYQQFDNEQDFVKSINEIVDSFSELGTVKFAVKPTERPEKYDKPYKYAFPDKPELGRYNRDWGEGLDLEFIICIELNSKYYNLFAEQENEYNLQMFLKKIILEAFGNEFKTHFVNDEVYLGAFNEEGFKNQIPYRSKK